MRDKKDDKTFSGSLERSLSKSGSNTPTSSVGQGTFWSKDEDNGPQCSASADKGSIGSELSVRFPMMKEFTHFHYEFSELGQIQISLAGSDDSEEYYSIVVKSGSKSWVVRRTYQNFLFLDTQIHKCVIDRHLSELQDLESFTPTSVQNMSQTVESYIKKFNELLSSEKLVDICCGTVLNFFEVDNRGNHHLILHERAAINIPGIAAAQATQKYASKAEDELSLEVGDMVSVIDKPSSDESLWWRGKKGFKVGFFPSQCVEIIGHGKMSTSTRSTASSSNEEANIKPVLRRRGKLITFLRMFFSNRVPRAQLKQSGIVKDRVFGCDLAEHLLLINLPVPKVLTCCTEVIEEHGLMDGIYRLSGVTSNIQRLRLEFDQGTIHSLMDEDQRTDIHTITAVLKYYFRELPNPLLTYQLYDTFAEAISYKGEDRIQKIHETVLRLPPPHYRTAHYLFKHLHHMSTLNKQTSMDSHNLAIVWAPNLMKSSTISIGAQVLHDVSVQATIVDAIITNFLDIFTEEDLQAREDSLVKRTVDERDRAAVVSSVSQCSGFSEASEQPYVNNPLPDDPEEFSVNHEVVQGGRDGFEGSTQVEFEDPYENYEWTPETSDDETESSDLETGASIEVNRKPRPSSVAVSTPSRLMTLAEAQEKLSNNNDKINDGLFNSDSEDMMSVFHTDIDFDGTKRPVSKAVTSPPTTQSQQIRPPSQSGWRQVLNRARPGSGRKSNQKPQLELQSSEGIEDQERGRVECGASKETITDSEISHLTRRQLSNSANNLQSLLNNTPDLLIPRTDLEELDCEDIEDVSLHRTKSHESYFGELPSTPSTSSYGLHEDDLNKSGPKTPGVIMRAGYDPSALNEILNIPRATWKRTNQSPDTTRLSGRSSGSNSSSTNTATNAQACPSGTAASPNARRRKIRDYMHEDPIKPQINTAHSTAHVSVLRNKKTSDSKPVGNDEESDNHYETIGKYLRKQEWTPDWDDSETQMVCNQANSARLSRAASIHKPPRSTDQADPDPKPVTDDSGEPLYANVLIPAHLLERGENKSSTLDTQTMSSNSSSEGKPSIKPRSNSTPYKMKYHRKETDLDIALRSPPEQNPTDNQKPRIPPPTKPRKLSLNKAPGSLNKISVQSNGSPISPVNENEVVVTNESISPIKQPITPVQYKPEPKPRFLNRQASLPS